jgi:hypothetical protein
MLCMRILSNSFITLLNISLSMQSCSTSVPSKIEHYVKRSDMPHRIEQDKLHKQSYIRYLPCVIAHTALWVIEALKNGWNQEVQEPLDLRHQSNGTCCQSNES